MNAPLPDYTANQFALRDPPECDLILKGGITSGIVYPYAILELATKYRFRSLGGTSAGAIAAAFAAAAEYSRSVRKDPAGFVRLKSWCDRLPDDLLSLFQPDLELAAATDLGLRALKAKGWRPLVRELLPTAAFCSGTSGLILGAVIGLASGQLLAGILAFLFGALLGAAAGAWQLAKRRFLDPLRQAFADLPDRMFGFCSGLTVEGAPSAGITDWLHDALQDIAFGPDGSSEVLTFGHLEKVSGKRTPIELRMVTTNLSMMRPHTLPAFGMQAGYDPAEWQALFPTAVLEHLEARSKPWKGMRTLPVGDDMPVLVATRMSLSFPLLFRAIPVHAEDYEAFRIARALDGEPKRSVQRMWLSDGGISSNFPIHLFDAPLPTRPTFAFSLDDLADATLERRVMLPTDTRTGLGLPIASIRTVPDFALQILWSAKDWQDNLLAGITGQRERIVRIFLGPGEGGLNLAMSAEQSRQLMRYGLEAGQLFADQFDFDEHRWRRLLAFYGNTGAYLAKAGAVWASDYLAWFDRYAAQAQSYRLSGRSRIRLRNSVDVLLVPPAPDQRLSPKIERRSLPRRAGRLRTIADY